MCQEIARKVDSASAGNGSAVTTRSSNGNGPVDPVLPGSEELWEGIKAAGLYVLNNYEADPESIAAGGRPVLRKRKHDGH